MSEFHQMRLHPEPFGRIERGEKKVECRLWDEKRRQLKVGDTIQFQLRPECTKTLTKQIVALHTFPTFEAMFAQFPEERVSDVYQYYTKEEEAKWGVVAIELG